MRYYLNLHHLLETRRQQAKENGTHGPKVIIVGDRDSGKSTLCQILLNYAVRMGWTPTYTDLDPGQGNISPPGSLASTPIQLPITSEDGYPLEVPLVYFFGHNNPSPNPELYKVIVENMSSALERRSTLNPMVSFPGTIINTMGWTESLGYELLLHSVLTLKTDIIIVINDQQLAQRLSNDLEGKIILL